LRREKTVIVWSQSSVATHGHAQKFTLTNAGLFSQTAVKATAEAVSIKPGRALVIAHSRRFSFASGPSHTISGGYAVASHSECNGNIVTPRTQSEIAQ
jgi:hypothetical protein